MSGGGTREIVRLRLPRRLVQRGPALAQGIERGLGAVGHVQLSVDGAQAVGDSVDGVAMRGVIP